MTIVVIPEGPVGKTHHSYTNSEGEAYYLQSLATKFGKLRIISHVLEQQSPWFETVNKVQLSPKEFEVIELYSSRKQTLLRKFIQYIIMFFQFLFTLKRTDKVFLFIPSYSAALAYLVCRLRQIDYIVYAASDWSPRESEQIISSSGIALSKGMLDFLKRMNLRFEKRIVKNAKLVLVISDELKGRYGKYNATVQRTIPRMNLKKLPAKIYERQINASGKGNFLFVGGLYKRKGIDSLIDEIRLLDTDSKLGEFTLNVVGSGADELEIKTKVKNFNLQDNVIFHGQVKYGEELFKIYRECDYFVFPSFAEGFPRVLYEAMLFNQKIICSGIPEIRKELEGKVHEVTFFNPFDFGDLSQKIFEVRSSEDLNAEARRESYKNYLNTVFQDRDHASQLERALNKWMINTQ